MDLFHGTIEKSAKNIMNRGVFIDYGIMLTDFGRGFYTVPEEGLNFARTTACYKQMLSPYKDSPACVKLKFNHDKASDLNILTFDGMTKDWLRFVLNNRIGRNYFFEKNIDVELHNWGGEYDIVIGNISDVPIVNLVDRIKKGELSFSDEVYDIISLQSLDDIGYQISFHTKRGLTCLERIDYTAI